jgi:acyl-CoA carboxylase epsilon subunit
MTFRIVRGNPTPEEIAAVTVVLAAVAAGSVEEPPRKRSRWADPAHRLRAPLRPGPDAWLRSGLPR